MLGYKNLWFVVANPSRAQIYQYDKDNQQYKMVHTFTHPESRYKVADLISDAAGSYKAHGTYKQKTSPKKEEALLFARELTDKLKKAANQGEFKELVLIAPGHFQHLYKQLADKSLSQYTKCFIDKDYTLLDNRSRDAQLEQIRLYG